MILSLTNFIIYIVDHEIENNINKELLIPLTIYKDNSDNIIGTNSEKLIEKANSQYSFSFNVELFIGNERNPLIDYLSIDRKIRLEQEGRIIDFYITSKKPSFSSNNISYSFECQDSFSYQLSKQNIDLSFSTDNKDLWNEIGPKTIRELTEKALEISYSDWTLDPDINNKIYQFPNNLYHTTDQMKVSMELDNTTAYNIIVEIANLFNAMITLDFAKKQVSFINKERIEYQGLFLKPDINLSSFSYGENGSSLYNIMHVIGGEDSYGNYVSILPTIPSEIANILICLADFKEEDITINKDNYYLCPDYYKIKKDGSIIYYYKVNEIYSYKQVEYSNTFKEWQESKNTTEFKNIILAFYRLRYPDNDISSLLDFFYRLDAIPHYSSFLYDFSYWKESGLLSENRYDNLIKLLNIDLRNINLLYSCYNNMYISLNFKLQSIIAQEEELIMSMASEDASRANYNDNVEINNNTTYILRSTKIDNEYYLPIGIIKGDDTYQYIQYGVSYDNKNITYSIPDFSIIRFIEHFYVINNNSPVELSVKNTSINDATLEINGSLTNGQLVYVKCSEIESTTLENSGIIYTDIDGVIDSNINSLQSKVLSLWNYDYFYYNQSLNGDGWLQSKINALEKAKNTYYDKKRSITAELSSKFGVNWKDIDKKVLSETNINSYVDYCYLIEQLNKISIYIGGEGFRKYGNGEHYSYKGYYDYYIELLNILKSDNVVINTKQQNLTTIISNLLDQRNELMKNELYGKYKDIIRETKYENSTEITSDGLYSSAYKQFLIYKTPTKSYSSNYITNFDLENIKEEVNIGDLIKLSYSNLNTSVDKNSLIITLDKSVNYSNNIFVEYYSDNNKFLATCFIKNIDKNKILIQFYDRTIDVSKIIVESLYIENTKYSFNLSINKILNTESVYNNNPIELRVSGITKDLRSNNIQLTVEENTIYNSLVDRLIYLLKEGGR